MPNKSFYDYVPNGLPQQIEDRTAKIMAQVGFRPSPNPPVDVVAPKGLALDSGEFVPAESLNEQIKAVNAKIAAMPLDKPVSEVHTQTSDKPAAIGGKTDAGKVRMELMADLSRATKGVAEVLTWAVTDKKPAPYKPGSWQQVPDFFTRYMGALLRHLNNIHENGMYVADAETGLLDLKHLATDAMFLAEMAQRDIDSGKAVLGQKLIKGASVDAV